MVGSDQRNPPSQVANSDSVDLPVPRSLLLGGAGHHSLAEKIQLMVEASMGFGTEFEP